MALIKSTVTTWGMECDYVEPDGNPCGAYIAPHFASPTRACDLAKASDWTIIGNVRKAFCREHAKKAEGMLND